MVGFGGHDFLESLRGLPNEERFLREHRIGRKPVFLQNFRNPVPTNMAGKVLLAGLSEQVVRLPMSMVGSHRALGTSGAEFGPGFAIIESEKESEPVGTRNFLGEFGGMKRQVEMVSAG